MTSLSKIQRALTLSLILAVLVGGIVWMQTSATPAAAQEPGAGAVVVLVIPSDGVSAAAIGTPPVFNVGDTFTVAVVAQGITDPGLFGSQFEISYDPAYLAVQDGSLVPGAAMLPVLNPVNQIDNGTGLVQFAASRQGDLDNLLGDVTLATLTFQALAPTEPPDGQTTTLHLQNIKLGSKGGIEVPVTGTSDLDVIISGEVQPTFTDISGNVTVPSRAADNQAGHEVVATDGVSTTLSATTGLTGSFVIAAAPPATYTVTADSAGFLAATCADVVHTDTAPTVLADVSLIPGDLDDSDTIDIADAVAIGAVFGAAGPQVADLNADGVVDILDLILMAANFGRTSADNPWLCQPL